MKKFFQIFAITAIAAGAYFVTASKQEVVDGDQVSVEMNVEMMSIAEASSPGRHLSSCRHVWNLGRACDRARNRIAGSAGFNRPDQENTAEQLWSMNNARRLIVGTTSMAHG